MSVRIAAAMAAGLMAAALFVSPVSTTPAEAKSNCKNTGSFDRWLSGFKQQAVAEGISKQVVNAALSGVKFNPSIIRKDRTQIIFSDDWLTFSGKLVSASRLKTGKAKLKTNAKLFKAIERKYGVPGEVITAFWALETDFGGFMGNDSTIASLATLAYDCRRPEEFQGELISALKLVQRGDLKLAEMKGAWAGEIGQLQFLPSYYEKHAVDFDGDGRRNMIKSGADALASAANYMKFLGWKRGQPWLQEVEVPDRMPWEQADVTIKHSRAQWAKWGVKLRGGKKLRADRLPASLILPMGKDGPAFLAYPNFDAYLTWNESLTYSLTAAYLGTRYLGAPKASPGHGTFPKLGYKEVRAVQQVLERKGYDVGGVDGTLGAKSRAAVRDMQLKLKMPADGYPSTEFIRRIR
jgi:lytic murein transglycosylase